MGFGKVLGIVQTMVRVREGSVFETLWGLRAVIYCESGWIEGEDECGTPVGSLVGSPSMAGARAEDGSRADLRLTLVANIQLASARAEQVGISQDH